MSTAVFDEFTVELVEEEELEGFTQRKLTVSSSIASVSACVWSCAYRD